MLITLSLTLRTRKTEEWLLSTPDQIYAVKTTRSRNRDTVTTLRYVINRTLKLNSSDYMFLGNRRINGYWITEWMRL